MTRWVRRMAGSALARRQGRDCVPAEGDQRHARSAVWRRASLRAGVILAALLPPVMAPAAGEGGLSTARAWLDAVEARLLEADGRALRLLPVPGRENAFGTEDGQVFVFHAGLSTVWHLDSETVADAGEADVIGTAALLREESLEGGRILAHWLGGAVNAFAWPLPVPEFEVARERHPLAIRHDALLSAPLARPVAGLPAGWRFRTDGLVLPGDPDVEVLTATFWRSDGDRVVIEHADGAVVRIALDELVAAIMNAPAGSGATEGEGAE